jgi:NADH-quinone oxidoreductase subunit J
VADPILIAFAVLIAVFSVVVLCARNPITCAVSLIAMFFFLALTYGFIGAHFIAAIQLVVYAGAVMVLFIFSIMLLNLNHAETDLEWKKVPTFLGVGLSIVTLGSLLSAILHRPHVMSQEWTPEHILESGGNVNVLAATLFSKYFVPFEVVSLILLVAMMGTVVLAKRKVD